MTPQVSRSRRPGEKTALCFSELVFGSYVAEKVAGNFLVVQKGPNCT